MQGEWGERPYSTFLRYLFAHNLSWIIFKRGELTQQRINKRPPLRFLLLLFLRRRPQKVGRKKKNQRSGKLRGIVGRESARFLGKTKKNSFSLDYHIFGSFSPPPPPKNCRHPFFPMVFLFFLLPLPTCKRPKKCTPPPISPHIIICLLPLPPLPVGGGEG